MEDTVRYKKWISTTFATRSLFSRPSLHETFVEAIVTAMDGRSFLVSQDHRFGLCFPTTQPGNEVWVFTGIKVPFIVRRNHQAYRLIGECYLGGAMYDESKGPPLQEIMIR